MNLPPNAWVFDTGPLRHFAVHSWLGVIKFLAGDRRVYIPDSVRDELSHAVDEHPSLRDILDADWIHVYSSSDIAYITAFGRYEQRLAVGKVNRGECGVLAMGAISGCEIVLDDQTPRTIAREEHLQVTTTLAILCRAIRAGQLTVALVEALADDLITGDYYLPFGPGGFRRWALEEGQIEHYAR